MNLAQFIDKFLTAPQYIAPQHTLSHLVWRLTRVRQPFVRSLLIRLFIRVFKVDLSQAEIKDPSVFASFNDFFTRALTKDARPIPEGDSALFSPADGAVSQFGTITDGCLLQAKGRAFTLASLIGDPAAANNYNNGEFITVYLSPRDYHRVHTPVTGKVLSIRYIRGRLFSVNERTTRAVDNLFSRNERVVVELETSYGNVTMVMVGAMLVSSMELTCCDLQSAIAENRNHDVFNVPASSVSDFFQFERGDELGRFNMGSTVILIAQQGRIEWNSHTAARQKLHVGEVLGRWIAEGSKAN